MNWLELSLCPLINQQVATIFSDRTKNCTMKLKSQVITSAVGKFWKGFSRKGVEK
jgi:hypothetical protein